MNNELFGNCVCVYARDSKAAFLEQSVVIVLWIIIFKTPRNYLETTITLSYIVKPGNSTFWLTLTLICAAGSS